MQNVRKIILHSFIVTISILNMHGQEIVEEDYLNFQDNFFEALMQHGIGNYDNALERLERCKELNPNENAVNFEFAKNYFSLKEYFEAEEYITLALSSDGSNLYLLEYKKQILLSQNKVDEAIEVQQTIIGINPKKKVDLPILFLKNKEKDKALEYIDELERSNEITPRLRQLRKNITYQDNKAKQLSKKVASSELGDRESAIMDFKRTKDYKIIDKVLQENLASKNYELLIQDADLALQFFPSQANPYLMKAIGLLQLGEPSKAISSLDIGIDFVVDNRILEKKYYTIYAQSYTKLNRPQKAIEYQKKAAKL